MSFVIRRFGGYFDLRCLDIVVVKARGMTNPRVVFHVSRIALKPYRASDATMAHLGFLYAEIHHHDVGLALGALH